jgi:hypothetical protein
MYLRTGIIQLHSQNLNIQEFLPINKNKNNNTMTSRPDCLSMEGKISNADRVLEQALKKPPQNAGLPKYLFELYRTRFHLLCGSGFYFLGQCRFWNIAQE